MPIYQLPPQPLFPDPRLADGSGLLAVGGDLSPARLLGAYQRGIFPWYSEGQPLLWWSPDPRMVLPVEELHVGRSLRKRIRKAPYRITLDRAFARVIDACGAVPRPGQHGTWITADMRDAYVRLHHLGYAHSVEAWDEEGRLVGGLYGVSVGRAFAGESMFARADDASKIAFVHLVRQLHAWGHPLIDCQMHTHHLARFGAREVPRETFLRRWGRLTSNDGRPGPWSFDEDLQVLAPR
jgi:leucyl/phenylalanyl-tRNA---protein transferase